MNEKPRPGQAGPTRRPVQLDVSSPSVRVEPTRPPPRRRVKPIREPRRMNPALRLLNGVLTLFAVLLVGGGAAVFWVESQIEKTGPLQEPKVFVVRKGDGARDVAERLESDGIIASQHLFVLHYVGRSIATWFGAKPQSLKAGDYQIRPQASIADVAEALSEGRSVLFRITLPEGLTSWQIVERLKADKNLTGEVEQIPLEGSLLPDTYKFSRGMTRAQLLDLMRSEQDEFLAKAWANRAPDLPLKTVQEALVLASIVEKETGRNDERERVAAVFVNRLRANMRLQSDPTILYGIAGGQVSWGRTIMKQDIQQRTSHNTYQIDGLPPTPICNPGRASILAVLNPAKTKELFFVADGNGGHVFSETLKDHNAAVANWRKVEKEIQAKRDATPAKPGVSPVTTAPAAPPARTPTTTPTGAPLPAPKTPAQPVSPVTTAPPETKPAR